MIHFTPPDEPVNFDRDVRQPGIAWLERNSVGRPKDYWNLGQYKSASADGFGNLCAYSAMYEPVGTVDHYRSCNSVRRQAYEWSNYRFASGWINSSKQDIDDRVLDPFQVEDGWFEILLPSLQLVLTDAVPQDKREIAQYTLMRLHLRDDERVIRQRREWYRMYQDGGLSLEELEKKAPLIARAIRKSAVQARDIKKGNYEHSDDPGF